ncbi:MAG: flavodoxin family protein [Chloroflexi bacterium]|nr:flavodoxin family protein [Chloroflexota bacterium]
MSIIGFSSGGAGHLGNTDRMVQAILDRSGLESEFVKLTDLTFSGCKGCVDLCARPQVCRLDDEAMPNYQKIKEADAVVFGSAVYSGNLNAIALSFLERFFGYRHVTPAIKDKPFVAVICGHRNVDDAVEQIQKKLRGQGTKLLGIVKYLSHSPPCLYCGRHRECSIGALYRMIGETAHSLESTAHLFQRWENNCETLAAIEEAAAKLREEVTAHKTMVTKEVP